MLRLKAEADAADKSQRLRVYAEQLAEYAADKATAADAVLSQAQALMASLQPLLAPANGAAPAVNGGAAPAAPAPGGGGAELAAQLAALQQQLEQAALEARHFAEQQRADVERSKRSLQQVCGRRGGGGPMGAGEQLRSERGHARGWAPPATASDGGTNTTLARPRNPPRRSSWRSMGTSTRSA
jgi:hypothetical protein